MIPLRIAVQGFLCYRAEQAIDFEHASLWMLAGLNGSGKSAVFDGVTYALFGGHRAGKEHAEELINKNCDRATVAFDFLLDGERYQAHRTLRRKKQGGAAPTQQISRWRPAQADQAGGWEAVPDTTNKRNFDAWVRDNLGLNYETFTSSVLLMQGKAEKLLAAAPKERFEVLAGIVDLERYQRLHERADDKRRQRKDKVDLLQRRLEEVPEVNAADLEQIEQVIGTRREAVERCRAEDERLQRLEMQAERWQDLQGRLADIRKNWQQAEKLLAEGEAIERAAARLAELGAVLPAIAAILDQRQRLTRSRQVSEALVLEQRGLAARLGECRLALDRTRKAQEQLHQAAAGDQQRAEAIGTRLRELSGWLARASLCEQQRQEAARIEAALAKLPADPTAAVVQRQEAYDRLLLLRQALPLLTRLAKICEEFQRARHFRANLIEEEAKASIEIERLTAHCACLAEALEQATAARQQADDRATQGRTLLEEACRQREQIDELSGAKVCRLCGQELTPGHFAEEREKREKIRSAAEVAARQAATARAKAIEAEKQARLAKGKTDASLAEIREHLKECRRSQGEMERGRQRQIVESAQIYQELPEPFRLRVSPKGPAHLLDTAYPTDTDLTAAREEARHLPTALKNLQEARAVQERFALLRAERDAAVRSLKMQEASLPGDMAALHDEHRRLEAEDHALKAAMKARRAQLETERQSLDRLHHDHQTLREQLADKDQQWSAEEVRREECQKALDRAETTLPADWRTAAESVTAPQLQSWQAEQRGLEQQGLPARMDQLAKAKAEAAILRQRLRELEEESEQVPDEARTQPKQISDQRNAVRQQQAEEAAELLRAERNRERLTERLETRRKLQEEHAEQDRQHHRHRLLAELLGRNRLQLHLVRRAERGIVDFANAVLDRLSGGQLYLRLRGDETTEAGADQALQLEAYNRTTGQTPIAVSFLSGSQRFRVAVSLALGIGQYASRQHRPIESVIIDEGFGCLDRQGRQVMIQELQNLRGQLRCILLVSHQEEFADAFADVYHFELTDGGTRVTRAQR